MTHLSFYLKQLVSYTSVKLAANSSSENHLDFTPNLRPYKYLHIWLKMVKNFKYVQLLLCSPTQVPGQDLWPRNNIQLGPPHRRKMHTAAEIQND